MHASTRAFLKRGGAVCAAAVVLLGGTTTAATAADVSAPVASATASATPTASPTSTPSATTAPAADDAALQDGLAEAVERDLGLTVEEFTAQGEVAAQAAALQDTVTTTDPDALVSVDGLTITVTTDDAAAAEEAAGDTDIVIAAPTETAAPAGTAHAANVDALFADYVSTFGLENLQSIMIDGSGKFVIHTADVALSPSSASNLRSAPAVASTSDFAAKYSNVEVKYAAGPAKIMNNLTDTVGGQGILTPVGEDSASSCSIGWNGFNASGAPALITAGHCTVDDTAGPQVGLSDPTTDPAVGGEGFDLTALVGTWGFSQFGGPGNTPADIPEGATSEDQIKNVGTDVAVVDELDPALNQPAQVTDWTTPAELTASGPKVTAVSSAVVGAPICKSGRTTGWSCGTVAGVNGVFLVGGIPDETDPSDRRAVRGFSSTTLNADHGDSGGSIISGTTAVGMISAGDGVTTFGADLKTALAATPGYSVKIALPTPTITTDAPVYRQDAITGTVTGAPAGTTVTVTIDGVATDATLDASGNWSVKAPNSFGTFEVTVQAKNGFSTSAITTGEVEVIKETLPVPAFTTPANDGTATAPLTKLTGTGTPGSTLTFTGDVTGTVVVAADGTWTKTLDTALTPGEYTVTATASLTDWNDSPKASVDFAVVLAPAAILTPADGTEFALADAPTTVTGSNLAGATVLVTIDGTEYTATVDGTTWSVTLQDAAAAGSHTVSVVQTVDQATSAATKASFTVVVPAAAITTPADGSEFAFAKAPTTVTGSNVAGATVVVTVDGTEYPATVKGTTWSVKLPAAATAGSHTISAVQTVDGVPSAAATASFTVLAAPVVVTPEPPVVTPEPPVVTPENPVDTPEQPVVVNPEPASNGSADLANTGATTLALGGLGGLLLIGGGVVGLLARRRRHDV